MGNSKNNQRNSTSSDKVPAITKEILEKKLSSQNRIHMNNSNGSTQDFLRTPEAGVAGYVVFVSKCINIVHCCFFFISLYVCCENEKESFKNITNN